MEHIFNASRIVSGVENALSDSTDARNSTMMNSMLQPYNTTLEAAGIVLVGIVRAVLLPFAVFSSAGVPWAASLPFGVCFLLAGFLLACVSCRACSAACLTFVYATRAAVARVQFTWP